MHPNQPVQREDVITHHLLWLNNHWLSSDYLNKFNAIRLACTAVGYHHNHIEFLSIGYLHKCEHSFFSERHILY